MNETEGSVFVSGNADVVFWDNVINDGSIRVSSGSQAIFFGHVSGNGSYNGDGSVIFENTFSPGSSPGTVEFGGDVVLGTDTHLMIELGGSDAGNDKLLIAGDFTANGTLDVHLINGFDPSLGDSFDLFDFTSVSGSFSAMNFPALKHGRRFDTSSLMTAGTIMVVPEPATVGVKASAMAQ